MEIVIDIKHLKKAFKRNEVLKDVNLQLAKGENLVILGKSGTGKSVLPKCIVRLIEADRGEIHVLGKDILKLEATELDEVRKKVGYLFQGGALYDSMTVKQNLVFQIRRTQLEKNKAELRDLVEEALANVGLKDAMQKMPAELSGGMKKRIGLARTLILKPSIILYDEPTTGLDPVTAGEISELILDVQQKYNTSSIIITHDMKCARMTSNSIRIMKNGKFEVVGSYDELRHSDDPEVRAYFS
ncbi:ABC transporter ATP-binding protein [Sunxiuqinia elliptica]|uniref:Phospholipid/cholesterol/gamma-HCH transport system ATP-binding protein n=1 Tax=Sunxiuqinia elliptica TaxID=655355 RepID=A0A1I2EGB5_9BACT|nr:ATP-binding cassette domain-containing protein [Sunxiuqinia elliptica]SFE91518.1 phospholipid/cholesterol/gamma-HCH transport system ATP-binding protein [Sunxiuqinia elliptica]